MGRPATNKRVRTKPAAKPKDGSEKGAGKQPAKKKTASGGARVPLNVPHVAADKPHEEGRAAKVLDRAVLLPRHLVPLSVIGLAPSPRAHDMRMRVSICASPNAKTMRRCTPSCVSWQREQSLIHVADRGRCSSITCAPTQAQCTHTALSWGHPSTRHAAQVSMRTMPLNSTHTHTQTSMPAILSPDAQVYYYNIIMILWSYYL